MDISTSYYSSVGGRSQNEDCASIMESSETVLCIVADGLGGHEGGAMASKTAIQIVNAGIGQTPLSAKTLRESIAQANQAIFDNPQYTTMKTTIAALWFGPQQALAATVGDTRIYQFRGNEIIFHSRDHSVAQMQVLAGDLEEKDIRTYPGRNRLVRALGAQDTVNADIQPLDVEPGDSFLLCSDGFWEHVWEEEMLLDQANTDSAKTWLNNMHQRVSKRISETGDNHTAIAIMIR